MITLWVVTLSTEASAFNVIFVFEVVFILKAVLILEVVFSGALFVSELILIFKVGFNFVVPFILRLSSFFMFLYWIF